MKQKMKASDKRLVAVAFNVNGAIDNKTLSEMRHTGWKRSDSIQTIVFNDPAMGGQAAFVFEINDVKDRSLVKRIGYRLCKLKAAATAYVRKGVFVKVSLEGKTSVFPVHGA